MVCQAQNGNHFDAPVRLSSKVLVASPKLGGATARHGLGAPICVPTPGSAG